MTLQERYERLRSTPSSINEHMDVLRDYASCCESIAEFGVDIGQSTTAFLMGQPKRLLSVDVVHKPELDELANIAAAWEPMGDGEWKFLLADSRYCTIPEVDLLFIDSSHHYAQMQVELREHHAKVRRYLMFHDTVAYGELGEGGLVGINPAIREFMAEHPEWVEIAHYKHNNGLQILERVNAN